VGTTNIIGEDQHLFKVFVYALTDVLTSGFSGVYNDVSNVQTVVDKTDAHMHANMFWFGEASAPTSGIPSASTLIPFSCTTDSAMLFGSTGQLAHVWGISNIHPDMYSCIEMAEIMILSTTAPGLYKLRAGWYDSGINPGGAVAHGKVTEIVFEAGATIQAGEHTIPWRTPEIELGTHDIFVQAQSPVSGAAIRFFLGFKNHRWT